MKYKFRSVLPVIFALTLFSASCGKDDDGTPGGGTSPFPDYEPLSGSPTNMSLQGNTFEVTLDEGTEGISEISVNVKEFENGISTLSGSMEITNPFLAELATLVAEKYPDRVNADGQTITAGADVVNTNEGIAIVQPDGEAFNVIKYDAEVGTVYANTHNGVTTERTVVAKSTLSSFFPDETGPDAELPVIAVEETKEDYPMLEKARYYFNEERGLVRAAAHFTNGDVAYIDIQSEFSNEVIEEEVTGEIFNPDLTYGEVADVEGNTYKTIAIGTQTWMAENLRTSKYANGETIPHLTLSDEWQSTTGGAWSHFLNESDYNQPYGKLYNFHAVSDERNLCPVGWHIPSDEEWDVLISYLGGASVAGLKMKSAGTQYWPEPNAGVTNSSGHSALPGGFRNSTRSFFSLGYSAFFWSSTEAGPGAWNYRLDANSSLVERDNNFDKKNGYSCRCISD